MKHLKFLFLVLGLTTFGSFAQDVPVEDLPVATIDSHYLVTIPATPLVEYYYIDISSMDFTDASEAETRIRETLEANLTSFEVNFSEGYAIMHVHIEYMGDDLDVPKFQTYLGYLAKPH